MQHLHMSIGPVQSFVSQARRTRDFWAGSFLLSWMAGQLMAETMRRGGKIVFPYVGDTDQPKDNLLAAILGKPSHGQQNPTIGSLPNRFKASVPESIEPEKIVNTAKQKWQALAGAVWSEFVEPAVGDGRNTRAIWNRQIDGFWEIQWVMGTDPEDGSDNAWLGARKNWRSHWPPEEGGDHCTVMGDWQELSGYTRSRQRKRQDAFWKVLQGRTGRLDLREGERLCAIALVKRLFPKLKSQAQKEFIGWPFEVRNWPSTVYLAATPWLAHMAKDQHRCARFSRFVKTVEETVGKNDFGQLKSEGATSLPALVNLRDGASLDGNFFMEAALANPKATPLSNGNSPDSEDSDSRVRKKLIKELVDLGNAVGCPAQPYYALLMMDGDRLGKLLRENKDKEKDISRSLAKFVKVVPGTVQKRNGVTVYAGGDDVVALLPITEAVECAIDLREKYGSAFGESLQKDKPTASSSIVFSHYHNPLRDIMKLAHKELDETAKETNGRDSLALAVLSPGGVKATWVAKFGELPKNLLALRDQILKNDYSTNFFYHLRQRYEDIIKEGDWPAKDLQPLVLAEYIKGATLKDQYKKLKAEDAVSVLLAACGAQKGAESPGENQTFQLDGAFIARFLAETTSFNEMGKEGAS